ncbi:TonB-dependent receptor [Sphingomonas histidinilytica]|uniref:Iron complex outermembrane recepter protein n=1 Tax=Rhizorhabdus histidinilytica TaxID=439228 RepID=A0A1T4ZT02_9SPHN|nr:TonB-dependent receptor [Rhizorhabdus histidinilytica]MBO9377626.1 TonB-dependent receptor [Rhizorhabdus histidinilytica]SKB25870.1 iron complex outermembrane recepter protein [Rhizorhabdus histidinilytica]
MNDNVHSCATGGLSSRSGSSNGGRLASACALMLIGASYPSMATARANDGAIAAASADQAPLAADATGTMVEDIVVTATRRAVNLQKVPVTITALPASTLKSFNITGVLQLSDAVPGLQVAPSGGNNIYLRGVGTTSAGYNEAQVAVYIDGLYLPNPAMSIFSFNNIEQIEVLKGPQGTLYGRNATAGLIAVRTRDPGEQLKVDASLGYDNYDTRTETLYVSAPITGSLSGNVAVYDTKQYQGWGKNVFTSNDIQKNRETGVQAKLLWDAGPNTRITTNFIFDTNNRTYGYGYHILPGTIGADGTTYVGRNNVASRIDASAPFKAYIGALKIQQDLGFATLMSLTGYQHSSQKPTNPANNAILGQPLPGQGSTIFDFDQTSRTWSQELQLTSKAGASRLEWVAGLYYYNDKTKIAAGSYNTCVGNACATGAAPNIITGRPKTDSYSGYVDGTYKLFDATRLTMGLRYTNETKSITGEQVPLPGFPNSVTTFPPGTVLFPGQPFPGFPNGIPTKLNFEKVTYRVVLAQDFGPNVHGYVSNNYGFKSGGFNANNFNNPPVKPELLNSYEVGVKSELFDRRVRFNLAYFHYDYKDVQVRSAAPPAPPGRSLLQNVGKERIKGVNGDFSIIPVQGLTINGGFEVLDAKYTRNPGQSCSSPGPNQVVGGVLVGTVVTVPCDLAGFDVAFASPFSATLGFSYKLETEMGVFTLNASDRYTKRYPLLADQSIYAPGSHIVNASLAWTAPDGRFDAQVYVRNLTNKYTYVTGYATAAGFAVVPGAPRVIGATVGFHL